MVAIKTIFKYLFWTFVLIQLIRVDIPKPQKIDKNLEIKAPREVMNIFKRACYDCHSDEFKLPWYSQIAPLSWQISRHIDLGRQWVNFSIWNSYTQEQKDTKLEEIYKSVHTVMPLKSYLYLHKEANMNKADRDLIRKWTGKAPF